MSTLSVKLPPPLGTAPDSPSTRPPSALDLAGDLLTHPRPAQEFPDDSIVGRPASLLLACGLHAGPRRALEKSYSSRMGH